MIGATPHLEDILGADLGVRHVCQFSCGAASAVATKMIIESKQNAIVVNAFVAEEHADNRRFLADCEKWLGIPVIVVRDAVYGASARQNWRKRRFIKQRFGMDCSASLKRKMLATIALPGDVNVIGFTSEEIARFDRLQDAFPEERFCAPLIDAGLDKSDCLAIIDRAGIRLPEMYLLGYDNANCIGCPKGGQNYWQKIRKDFPADFAEIMEIQENIGPGANFLSFRSGPRGVNRERMSLRELPEGDGNLRNEPSFSCSFFCEQVERDFNGASA